MDSQTKRRSPRRRARRLAAGGLLVLLLAYCGLAYVWIPSVTLNGAVSLDRPVLTGRAQVSWPAYGQAAIGTLSHGIITTSGSDSSVPIASVAKVMTALAVLRQKPFRDGDQGATLTLTQADVDLYNTYLAKDGSVALVAAGEQLSEYQALQALLLPSANNMADSLANWAFGSIAGYTAYANQYAGQLGMSQTHFADASGFDPATVSSAGDLVRLGQAALHNDVIADIVDQTAATIPVAGTVRNVNSLLGSNGVVGIKTGNTDQAGGCLLFAAAYDVTGQKVMIIGALLGAPHLANALQDSNALLASAETNFISQTIISRGQTVGSYRLPWGADVRVKADSAIRTVSWKGNALTSRVTLQPLKPPAKAGFVVGKISVNGSSVGPQTSVSASLARPVSGPSLWWRLLHPVQLWHLRRH